MTDRPHVVLLYHFFHPDDVISARLFSDMAEGLTARGWDVTAVPCNHGCRDESLRHPLKEDWNGIRIRRTWRPALQQASNLGRLLNSAWMLAGWTVAAAILPRRRREAVVVGTDPVFGVLAALPWRALRRRTGIIHWCHDLHPEASIAEGMVRPQAFSVRLLRRFLRAAYRRCDVLADLGPCMRELLAGYGSSARRTTLTPWSLVEPPAPVPVDPATRRELFGDARLALLYSGNFGRAHGYVEFPLLARELRNDPIHFCFAGRGNRMDELKKSVTTDDGNVSFAGFAPESELEKRLGACDLHLVSLRPEWTGTVVPSKFFGALAAGRGVVFAGDPESAIGRWVREFEVGWVVTPGTVKEVAAELRRLAADPTELLRMRERCFAVYHAYFAKMHQIDLWDDELRALVGRYNRAATVAPPGVAP